MKKYFIILIVVVFAGCKFDKTCKNFQEWNEKEKTDIIIQKFVDNLPERGGKVVLPNGLFSINKSVSLRDNVWLQGEGRGTVLLIADSLGIILKGLKGVHISDLTIKSAERYTSKAGIVIDDCGDCQINNVLTQGFKLYGIWMRNNSFLCELRSCKSADNGRANFYFDGNAERGRGGDFVPNIVNNCISYGGKYGFEFNRTIVINLTGCAVFQSLDYGYYLHSNSNSVNISGSRSFQVGTDAVYVDHSHEVNISSNIFCWQRGNGIVLDNAIWGTVASNNIIDSGTRTRDGSYMNGIVFKNNTEGIQVTGNAVFNWGDQPPMEYGILEDKSCRYNLIANNNINYFTKKGVLTRGKGTLVNNNVVKGDSANIGMDRKQYPDFDTLRIHKFIFEEIRVD
jgi:hypothetical protein